MGPMKRSQLGGVFLKKIKKKILKKQVVYNEQGKKGAGYNEL